MALGDTASRRSEILGALALMLCPLHPSAVADPFTAISEQADPSFKPSAEMVEAGKQLDPKLLQLLTKQGAILRNKQELKEPNMAEQPPADLSGEIDTRLTNKEIVYIRGNGGEPLQKELPFPTLDPQSLEEISKGHSALLEQTFQGQLTVRELPNCREAQTVKSAIKAKLEPGEDSQVVFDLLFMRKSEIPLDAKEIFGAQPLVVPFDPEFSTAAALSAQGLGVKCLPTRIRITSLANYTHTGKDALKNYDEEPDGVGVLDQRFGGPVKKNSNKKARDRDQE